MTFKQLNIIQPILTAIETIGYNQPTAIQAQSIPFILEGHDIIGCAQTGTGKTASFSIPILQLLHQQTAPKKGIRSLILTPTRELAIQIDENFKAYSTHLKIKHLAIFGGVSQHKQVGQLKKGVDVVIATPGRLLDLLNQQLISLQHIEIVVLDEADRMLDMGFVKDVNRIFTKIPTKRQTLFFSATMPVEIKKLAMQLVRNPKEVHVSPVSSTATTIEQSVYFAEKDEKLDLLFSLLNDATIERSLVFTRTKHGADRLAKKLGNMGIAAAAIHGNKSQNARQRALSDFKANKMRVLIATDIAARGIDIEELPHVVNYELPNVPESYVHRIGRTGRAGAAGVAVSFCAEDEVKDLKKIEKVIGIKIPVKANPSAISRTSTPEVKEVRTEKKHSEVAQKRQKRNSQRGEGQNRNRQKSKEHRATNTERRATNNERRTPSNERRTPSNERRTTSNERRATNNEQQKTSGGTITSRRR
ncbi:DEAD/DEAH box helicase [Myroides sp. NP-2]|uniref:DEAD/DEAH box helicase n=1 Tax=Myroides sp. NP-2 TaxID=2759945 RepID=UPI0015F94883|nr:DEAD/DEAH box helicase [Myroides sp. NP-2]MBB1149584.1 DEAD/DEAH box helicase [Myroides sp. NP-2]